VVRKAIRYQLAIYDIRTIDEAENALGALTLFREHAPNLIILDLMMPESQGIGSRELLERKLSRIFPEFSLLRKIWPARATTRVPTTALSKVLAREHTPNHPGQIKFAEVHLAAVSSRVSGSKRATFSHGDSPAPIAFAESESETASRDTDVSVASLQALETSPCDDRIACGGRNPS
jgi:CheY-like chemotaxis protein